MKKATDKKPQARCNNSSGCPLGNKYIVIAIGDKLVMLRVSS